MLLGTINNRATRLLSPCAIADSDDSLRTCSHAIPLVWTARSSELELHNNTFAWGCCGELECAIMTPHMDAQ